MIVKKTIALLSISSVLMLGMTGCQSMNDLAIKNPAVTKPSDAVTLPLNNEKLQNYAWQLMTVTDMAGKPTAQGLFYNVNKPLLMTFDKDGKVRFKNTCNKLWADYMLTNDNVMVGQFASTRMMCEPALMTFDGLATQLLKGQFKLTQLSNGEPVLTITNASQVSVLKPVTKK